MKGRTLTELLENRCKGVKFRVSYSEFGTLFIDYISKKPLNCQIEDILKNMIPRPESYAIQQYKDGWK